MYFTLILYSHDVKFKPKGGAPPVLQFLNAEDHVVEVMYNPSSWFTKFTFFPVSIYNCTTVYLNL